MADQTVDQLRASLQAFLNTEPMLDAIATAQYHEGNAVILLRASAALFHQASLEDPTGDVAIRMNRIADQLDGVLSQGGY